MLRNCQQKRFFSFNRAITQQLSTENAKYTSLESLSTASDYAHFIRRCGNTKDLAQGKRIHAYILDTGASFGILVDNLLLEMYSKCGDHVSARSLFAQMQEKNSFSWNIVISAYAQNGHPQEAIEVFRTMLYEGFLPDRITCITVLDACGAMCDWKQGKKLNDSVVSELDMDVVLGTAVLTMYSKCRNALEAKNVFDCMPVRNVVSWSAMIAAYARNGYPSEALDLFVHMEHEGVKPNEFTFVSVLDACSGLGELEKGFMIHERILSSGFEYDVILSNTLIHMYGKCKKFELAREVFDGMETKNSVTWNTMIAACSRHELYKEAFTLLGEMDLEGLKANKVTFVTVIDACASMEGLQEGRLIHESIAHDGLDTDYAIGNALINLYGKCGSFQQARRVFEKIIVRDEISFTTLLVAYARHRQGRRAIELLKRMDQEGVKLDAFAFVNLLESCISIASSAPSENQAAVSSEALALGEELHDRIIESGVVMDSVLSTALVDMYGKCGNPEAARRVFDRLSPRNRDTSVWNAMLAAYVLRDQGKEAVELFRRMNLEGVLADKVSFLSVLEACSSVAALGLGRTVRARTVESGYEWDVPLTTAAINMYSKCGSLVDTEDEFNRACRTLSGTDVVIWSAMVAGYSQFGLSREALGCFYRMQQEGVRPDDVSFVSAISSCSHAGLVGEAVHLFTSIQADHGIALSEAHYGCLVDVLSRAGWLQEAERVIKKLPFKPYLSTWMTLLSACRTYGDLNRARRVAVKLSYLRPDVGAPYALLADVFCLNRKWDNVPNAKQSLVERGFIKRPGCSWIEIHDKVYEFFAGDNTPVPREEEVFVELERLMVEIRKAGYERDPIKRIHDAGETEKKFLLSYHSEKVAVVYGLIATAVGTPLRVVKNIGVCQDCHSVIKCISKVCGREISVRDNKGFHQFKDGVCSCRDQFS